MAEFVSEKGGNDSNIANSLYPHALPAPHKLSKMDWLGYKTGVSGGGAPRAGFVDDGGAGEGRGRDVGGSEAVSAGYC
jgi:hypothetical protein